MTSVAAETGCPVDMIAARERMRVLVVAALDECYLKQNG